MKSTAPIRILSVALALAWSLPGSAAPGDAIELDYTTIALHPEDDTVRRVGELSWRGGLRIRSSDVRFGGLSSILVSRDGRRMITLTDRGYWLTARLRYDRDGNLSGIGSAEIGALIGPDGRAVADTLLGDSESLARLGNALVVGLEGRPHRLWLYRPGGHPFARTPLRLTTPRLLRYAPVNGGIEALTELPGGGLFMVAEQFPKAPENFHAWLLDGRKWRRRSYARHGLFRPVGAAALPSGDVLVLERRFTWVDGVASRIVRLGAAALRSGEVLEGKELAVLDRPLVFENFEGIDTRPGPSGTTLIYLVSDDNFNVLQNTLLVMFALEP